MREMLKNFIISFLVVTNIFTATFCFRLNYKLERTRQQLEHYRAEFELAQNRESDIAESIRRTGEILNSSTSTLSGIRAQISEIRKNYEEMESLLYSSRSNNSDDYGNPNHEEVKEWERSQ